MQEKEIHLDLSNPAGRHPRTGRKKLSDRELARQKPVWREQWKRLSPLDDDMIDTIVEEYHTGPHMWPGNRILEGSKYGLRKVTRALKREWKGRTYTTEQFNEEAKRRLNEEVRRFAEAYSVDDPWAFEYYLTPEERKKHRRLTRAT